MSQSQPNSQSLYDRIMNQSKPQSDLDIEKIPATKHYKLMHRKPVTIAAIMVLLGAIIGGGILWATDKFPLNNMVLDDAPKNLPDSVFLKQAQNAGLSSCSTVFPLLGSLLTEGTNYKAQTRLHSSKPDKNSIKSNVGMIFSGEAYSGSAAGVIFSTPIGTACDGAFVRIVPFEKTCTEIEGTLPEGTKQSEALNGVAVYQLANNSGELMLLPASSTCIAITTVTLSDAPTH